MKKLFILLSLTMALITAGCSFGTAQNKNSSTDTANSADTSNQAENHKILIAYFSHSGNTRTLAQIIKQQTGGDVFEIVPQEPYPADYDQTVERFRRERAEDTRPEISGTVDNMDDYDVIFIGYPNWGSDMPHVVRTFLSQYDFSGKTIVPFCTNGGGGFGSSIETLKQLCPDSYILEGYQVNGRSAADSEDEVSAWLKSIDLAK